MSWHVGRHVPRNIHNGEGSDAEILVAVGPRDEAWQIAAQVVRAVNAHDDLLAACELMVRRCRGRMPDPRYGAYHDDCCEEARAAIAKAKGEQS